uniref:Glycosyltransferase family 4 protein n=1 Tax=Anaerolinea thermolimosa TaxID=229919 RepID=A0A7C4PJ67_9CHLR
MTWAGFYVASFVLSAFGAWAISRHADKIGLMDCPNGRSSHCMPTPKGGGIGIFFVFLLSSIVFGLPVSFWFPIGIMASVAFWGDRVEFSARLRLVIQLGLIALVIVVGDKGEVPGGLVYLVWICFWTLFIVGTANYYNFMDGINGIAGITGLLGFALLAGYVNLIGGPVAATGVAVCLSIACLGFLPLNMPKARVFMGDIGSILLGSVFAGLIWLTAESVLDFVCMASFLFPFYVDELTTVVVRLKDGENLTKPHRRHYYQLLANEKGIAHWKVSLGYGVFQLAVGGSVLAVRQFGLPWVMILLLVWSIIFWMESWRTRKSVQLLYRKT